MTVTFIPHETRGQWTRIGDLYVRVACRGHFRLGDCTVVSLERDGKQIDLPRAEWDSLLVCYATASSGDPRE